MYERFLKPILFSIDPELVHEIAIAALAKLSHLRWLLDTVRRPGHEGPGKEVFGLHFPNPVGLAAGFDKNGVAIPAWEALGFGFMEIGTITALGPTRESASADFPSSRDGSADQSPRIQQPRR